jgi:uncharacterized protein YjdB
MKKKHKFKLIFISLLLISGFACERNDMFEESLKSRVKIPLMSISLNSSAQNMYVGETYPLLVIYNPPDATDQTVNWSSSNMAIADVAADGVVYGNSAGSAVITATSQDGGKIATCDITVSNVAVMTVVINPSSFSLSPTGTPHPMSILLSYTISPSNATNQSVAWMSFDPAIAIVDTNGMVTAMAVGIATIQVTTNDGAKTAICTITVE